MHIVCRTSASMQSHTPFHRMRPHERPTPLDSPQQFCLVAMETPISANSRLHARLLRDDFSGPSVSFRPSAFSASQPSRSDRLFPTWSELNRSVRRRCAIKPGHAVSSGTYSTFPKYAKEKTKKKMPNFGLQMVRIGGRRALRSSSRLKRPRTEMRRITAAGGYVW